MNTTENPPGRIVVGVDGSDSSQKALRWALHQAQLTGSIVEALITWEYPTFSAGSASPEAFSFAENAQKVLAATVSDTIGEQPPVGIGESVVFGNAPQALLHASRGAELLVLGSRGHGGFTGALLGSVSQHCVQHASCPVVIVREGEH